MVYTKQNILYLVVRMRIIILLKDIRKERHISLEQLSKMTGISKSHLNYIEKQEKEPTLSVIVRIAKALNIDETDLYRIEK